MTEELLHIEGLRISASAGDGTRKLLVDGVDIVLSRGEILGLIGESGAGKTTIGLAALYYCRPGCTMIAGSIAIDGLDIRSMTVDQRRQLRGRRIAYIAQSAAASFNPAKTILSQVCEMPVRHGLLTQAAARRRAIELFEELDLPEPTTFGARYPHQVSGGQLQRAMAAMAMSCQPEILVLDEPTTALDVTTQIEVLAAIRKLIRGRRTAGLYISHDLAVVAQVADRIMVLRDGRMIEVGTADQILRAPRLDYTRRLVSARARPQRPPTPPYRGREPPLLRAQGVSAEYDKTRAVDDLSLDVFRAETLAVVGESGSGKSTLARVICGLKSPTSGALRFQDQDLPWGYGKRTLDQLRRIQMIYQVPDVALNPRQTVRQILARPMRFYFKLTADQIDEKVEKLLHMIDLPGDVAARLPHQLSGGQKQRICIARALAAEPSLVICDEVTSSLDQLVAEDILRLLERLQRELGIAYLFITHDLTTVLRIAHRVVVLLGGRVVAHGSIDAVFSPPKLPYTQRLLSSLPEMRTDWLDGVLRERAGSDGAESGTAAAAP